MQLHGVHHVTAVTGDVKQNKQFYTEFLGLRLVKKSVNQDDVSAYHMFYADKLGSPGTDMTFFDWPQTGPNVRGTDSISNTPFRVNGQAALEYWVNRLDMNGVKNGGIESFDGRSILRFEDPEEQRLALVDDQGADFEGEAWDRVDVPLEFALRGFYGVELTVPRLAQMEPILTQLLGFEKLKEVPGIDNPNQKVTIYTMAGGGPGKELHVIELPGAQSGFLGRGGVHHVAFRLRDEQEQQEWLQTLTQAGVPNSGLVDRYYFKSLYFRVSRGILFELATDGPGFASDEPLETLGERLALPPFLEPRRKEIEANLKPVWISYFKQTMFSKEEIQMSTPFVGSWRLVSQHSLYPDGTTKPSRGENAEGIIIYDAAGNIAVQLMRTDEHATDYTDLSDLKTAMQGFLAYYGRYEVDEAAGIVRHFVTGSSYFGYRGTTQIRHYEFSGDTLTLKAKSSFDDSIRLLVWRRVA